MYMEYGYPELESENMNPMTNEYDTYESYLQETIKKPEDPGSIKRMVIFSIVFFSALFHLTQWGADSLKVVYLKTLSMVGAANINDTNSLLQLCEERIKPGCIETALEDLTRLEGTSDSYARLGDFLPLKNRDVEAVSVYIKGINLLNKATTTLNIYYGIAKSYEKLGKHALAIEWYTKAIESKPDVVQVTVTENYVRLLRTLGMNVEAEKVKKQAEAIGNSKSRFSYL